MISTDPSVSLRKERILAKHAAYPVIHPEMMPEPCLWTFNPGAIKHNGEYIVLMDACFAKNKLRLDP